IELGGTTPGTQFDRLAVSGAASLNGTLNVTRINGFTVTAGDQFQIMTFGSRTGDFAVKNGFNLGTGLFFTEQFQSASLTLITAQAGITVSPNIGLTTTEAGGT